MARRLRGWLSSGAMLLVLLACPEGSPGASVACNTAGDCPSGQTCLDGLCATFLPPTGDGDGDPARDAGGTLLGQRDAGLGDGGPPDAGDGDGDGDSSDAGASDAGSLAPDSGPPDAGVRLPDEGLLDAGPPDAGPDAGPAVCGNGEVEPGEDCDDGDQLDDGNGCSASCQKNAVCGDGSIQSYFEACEPGAGRCCRDDCLSPASSGTVCRPSEFDCDAAETCDGSSLDCPVDELAPAGASCGDPTNTPCDAADTCDGQGACQDNLAEAGEVCASGDGQCDLEDTCDGSGLCLSNLEDDGVLCTECNAGYCRCSLGSCEAQPSTTLVAVDWEEIAGNGGYPATAGDHFHTDGSEQRLAVGQYAQSEETRFVVSFDVSDLQGASFAELTFVYKGPGSTGGSGGGGPGSYLIDVVTIEVGPDIELSDWEQPVRTTLPVVLNTDSGWSEGEELSLDATEAVIEALSNDVQHLGFRFQPRTDPGEQQQNAFGDFALVAYD